MSLVRVEYRRRSKPTTPRIDWSHPLAQGLNTLVMAHIGGVTELVRGIALQPVSGAEVRAIDGVQGVGAVGDGTADYWGAAVPSFELDMTGGGMAASSFYSDAQQNFKTAAFAGDNTALTDYLLLDQTDTEMRGVWREPTGTISSNNTNEVDVGLNHLVLILDEQLYYDSTSKLHLYAEGIAPTSPTAFTGTKMTTVNQVALGATVRSIVGNYYDGAVSWFGVWDKQPPKAISDKLIADPLYIYEALQPQRRFYPVASAASGLTLPIAYHHRQRYAA